MFMVRVGRQEMCVRNGLHRSGNIPLGLPGLPKSLRLGKDQPAIFSPDDAFFFHLTDQSGEVLRREGKQLGQLPVFQGDRYLDRFIGIAHMHGLHYLPEELLQALSSGKATSFAYA